ncbi:MAG: twin-arginine translocase TatA/TatE family subunit [Muribaculaceae bacterium]|nr:twin-arginine translocase TatA/TatE family subunit [Muribaculaceae bacterium]
MSLHCFILLLLGNMRGWQPIIILLIILLLFGGKKIPELMRGLGRGIHSFRKGLMEAKEEIERPLDENKESAQSEKADKDRQ